MRLIRLGTYVFLAVGIGLVLALVAATFAPPPWDMAICAATATTAALVLWKLVAFVLRVADASKPRGR